MTKDEAVEWLEKMGAKKDRIWSVYDHYWGYLTEAGALPWVGIELFIDTQRARYITPATRSDTYPIEKFEVLLPLLRDP